MPPEQGGGSGIMPAPLYRFDWKPCAAYVRTEDAAMIAEFGRFLDIGPEREENDPPDAGETTVTIEETNGMFYIATSDWRVRAHTRAQLLFAALEGLGQIFAHGFFRCHLSCRRISNGQRRRYVFRRAAKRQEQPRLRRLEAGSHTDRRRQSSFGGRRQTRSAIPQMRKIAPGAGWRASAGHRGAGPPTRW